ncbi:MAG: hypothetical protein A2513_01860 [Sulfurimonas sp. RIFOXYD12_FULL_33_39]|uniref:hypothetical protein n=1 Tax=unclassified Sulfurimonas TaxID=2623549 RepID=UPI0008CCC295|nr:MULTISPECIES: hypothetical protein [unclassified Sulfurimonas]OHE04011.1 MAG: hypothetical protein A3G74_00700 [Sulfurimonas sp. RIFCSPLOWO2_12_FULL_34_6]OHE08740.1 MAG: hypothetical protein A2513_01860 [Sulfurimonas sp. RIFOXYD12_FULL_33_39]OHE14025.1 MAG: hypothetical protein A2530_03185 [Sulfurimonas sp. RIFOXYD2_FULL_34_21]DAB27634.1 MAG TPA: hypothetical protein CFH78_06705 [Sulfurimonas sp. UBA10385]
MKKFNLFKEIIVADTKNLLQAINSAKVFGIKIDGEICYEPFGINDILIYKGIPDTTLPLESAFGKNYQILQDGNRVLIKTFSNWQEIIGFNSARATYDDTTADGVDKFSTKEMEDIGWNATEFNISYRTLVDVLENECEGTLICIEQEDPFQFSGLGFVDNLTDASDILFKYCQNEIKRLINEHEDYNIDKLSDDEQEAADFFKAI